MLGFVAKLTLHSGEVRPVNLVRLYHVGFDDDRIADIVDVTGPFALDNRIADSSDAAPVAEFPEVLLR